MKTSSRMFSAALSAFCADPFTPDILLTNCLNGTPYYVNGGRGCGAVRSVFKDTVHVSRFRFKIACSHQFFYHKTLKYCIPNIFFQVKSAYKSFFSCELSLNTGVFLSL